MGNNTKIVVLIFLGLLVLGLAITLAFVMWRNSLVPGETITKTIRNSTNTPMPMTLKSLAFVHNKRMPAEFTCDGTGIHPPLEFLGVPENTKSLALIMDDPDVPKTIREDGMWDHWLVWDMPATTTGLKHGEATSGIIGQNTSGTVEYAPPCPPDREHRYVFTLSALDTKLGLKTGATKAELRKAMKGHILEEAQLIGLYNRH